MLALVLTACSSFPDSSAAQDNDRPGGTHPTLSEFDEPLRELRPLRERSELEQDRVDAAVHAAQARLRLHRDDALGALRSFQRAWRYDPRSVNVREEIIGLAMNLRRNDDAARYAALALEVELGDAPVLLRLAAHLSERRRWDLAARLYERIAAAQADVDPDFTTTMIQLELGRLYFLLDRVEDAARAFGRARDALAQPEKSGLNDQYVKLLLEKPEQTYSLFAESFLGARRFDEALAMFHKADEARPNPVLRAYHEARVARERKQPAEVLRALEPHADAKLDEFGVDVYELLADAEYEMARSGGADESTSRARGIARLEKLLSAQPESEPLRYVLARKYQEAERLDEAAMTFQQMLEKSPSWDAWIGLRDVYRAQQRWEALLDLLGEVAASGSTEQVQSWLEPLAEHPQSLATVGEWASRRATQSPSVVAAYSAALIAAQQKRYDESERWFEKAARESVTEANKSENRKPEDRQPAAEGGGEKRDDRSLDRAIVYQTWGLTMFAADQGERAARVFREAIERRVRPESDPIYYYFLAGSLELLGRTDEALEAARKAAAHDAPNPQFHLRLAWIPYHAGRYEQAEAEYRRLVVRFDADPALRSAAREARLVLSNIAVLTNRLEQAEEWLEQILDDDPTDTGANNDLGYLWADQGKRLRRALRMCQEAVRAEPDNRAYRDSLGWALFRLGRAEEALAELSRAAGGEDPDGVVLDHLGDVQAHLGKTDEARRSWQRALEAFQDAKNDRRLEATRKKLTSG